MELARSRWVGRVGSERVEMQSLGSLEAQGRQKQLCGSDPPTVLPPCSLGRDEEDSAPFSSSQNSPQQSTPQFLEQSLPRTPNGPKTGVSSRKQIFHLGWGPPVPSYF